MTDKLDQDLDELLSRHLHACLDGQLGRAGAALHDELSPRPRWRLWTAVGTAVAAGLAVALVMISQQSHPEKIVKHGENIVEPIAQVPPMLQSTTWSPVVDDGTTLMADQPVRQLRRKIVDEVEWYDARNRAMVKTTMPRQQIYMIGLKTD